MGIFGYVSGGQSEPFLTTFSTVLYLILSPTRIVGVGPQELYLSSEGVLKAWVFIFACVFLILLGFSPGRGAGVVSKIPLPVASHILTMLLVGFSLIHISNCVRKLRDSVDSWHNAILKFQDSLNPLHLHCRLVENGLNKKVSISTCALYEVLIYSWVCWISIKLDGLLRRCQE